MTNATRSHSRRGFALPLLLSAVLAVVIGDAGIGLATGATVVARPRTLLAGSRRIYAFALGAHRITWISHTGSRGRSPGCEMYVRTLRTGLTSRAPLPGTGCGARPENFGPLVPVLASGAAAWVTHSSCGNSDCFWKIASIAAGARHSRIVDTEDLGCDYTCDGSYSPPAALAGGGNLLVYSAAGARTYEVKRIAGARGVVFFKTAGSVDSLTVGGGAVETMTRVLVGDGCGCVDQPVWSPDGSKIAYLHGVFYNQRIDPYPPSADVAVMNADGTGRHDLTGTGRVSGAPAWSPDGTRLAYTETSPTDPHDTVAVVNADGSGARELVNGAGPAWSPDGKEIAFSNGMLEEVNADGSNVHELGNGVSGVEPAWSPNGSEIAFSGGGDIWTMNADGSNAHQLGAGIAGDEPAWSPDGGRIVFRNPTGLAVIGADGTGFHQLTIGPDDHPSWSPDGTTIAFGSDRDDPYVKAHEFVDHDYPELYLVNHDGGNLRPLSFTQPSAFEQETTFLTTGGRRLPALPGLPALAGRIAAVGGTSSGRDVITLYDATTGKKLAAVPVGTAHSGFSVVGADAHWVVFRVGRALSALDTHSHRVVRLTTAAANLLDPSVSGRRVAWAENRDGQGRIRALELPS